MPFTWLYSKTNWNSSTDKPFVVDVYVSKVKSKDTFLYFINKLYHLLCLFQNAKINAYSMIKAGYELIS